MPKYYDPGYTQISVPIGSEEISPIRDTVNNVDKSIILTVLRNWILTGYAPAPPANAQLLGSSSSSTFQTISLGANLSISGSTLNAAGPPANAALLGSNSGSAFQSIIIGTNLSLSGTTLNATVGGNTTVSSSIRLASYTLALADAGTVVEMNVGSANTVTIPPNSSVGFPVGAVIEICQIGVGQTTIAAGVGVTIRNPGTTLAARTRWSSISLRQRAANEWVVSGDVT